jgi:hypothetical protein
MNTFQHESDGVPLNLLREELIDEGIADHIPEPRLNNILTNAAYSSTYNVQFQNQNKPVTH